MFRNHIFIRCNNVLARRHRTQHIVLCGGNPAHHLDDNGDFFVIQNFIEIIR